MSAGPVSGGRYPLVAAIDLDGTLLRPDKTVSGRTVAALAAATAAGVRVVIVTARPPRFVDLIASEALIRGFAVCSNGAVAYDLDTGAIDVVGPLPLPLAEQAARAAASVIPGATFAVETGRRTLLGPGYGHVATRETAEEAVEDLWSTSEGCVKLLIWSPAEVTGAVLDRLNAAAPGVAVSHSRAAGLIEVAAGGVTKASGLQRLCAGWGIGAHEVIAFGDAPNDLDMLRWAGTPVAVANAAPEVLAEVRARGGRVTASNSEDGVAAVLEEIPVVRRP